MSSTFLNWSTSYILLLHPCHTNRTLRKNGLPCVSPNSVELNIVSHSHGETLCWIHPFKSKKSGDFLKVLSFLKCELSNKANLDKYKPAQTPFRQFLD